VHVLPILSVCFISLTVRFYIRLSVTLFVPPNWLEGPSFFRFGRGCFFKPFMQIGFGMNEYFTWINFSSQSLFLFPPQEKHVFRAVHY